MSQEKRKTKTKKINPIVNKYYYSLKTEKTTIIQTRNKKKQKKKNREK